MRIRGTERAVIFNVWTARRTWFWSLVYPDQQGGAIGAASSEAEALHEAHAAIEQLPQVGDDARMPRVPYDASSFTRPFQNSQDSHISIGCPIGRVPGEFACSGAQLKRRAKERTMGNSYDDLWHVTLQQYAARVAAA